MRAREISNLITTGALASVGGRAPFFLLSGGRLDTSSLIGLTLLLTNP